MISPAKFSRTSLFGGMDAADRPYIISGQFRVAVRLASCQSFRVRASKALRWVAAQSTAVAESMALLFDHIGHIVQMGAEKQRRERERGRVQLWVPGQVA